MSCKIVSSILLIVVLLNTIDFVRASNENSLFTRISRTASRWKSQLAEFFNRFRAFFIGHSESTHQLMTNRGCGFAVDDEPKIYTKQTQIRSKIRGGDDAIWHTWPWIVALFTNPRKGWHCAGVLVNDDTILTAAHCLTDDTAEELKAIIGVHTMLEKLNPLNYYSIKSIHRHPDYKECCKNDLAIIKLTKSVFYGPKINSVCLPFQLDVNANKNQSFVNRTGVIIGWGDSSEDQLTNFINSFTLKQAEIRIFDNEVCHRNYENIFDSTTEICAGDYDQQKDTMNGDSGGPLLVRQSDGRWIVLGITSYGSPHAYQPVPGVYVKVSAYEQWIAGYL